MNGELPPSSSDSFFTVEAHWAYSSLPTAVEPAVTAGQAAGAGGGGVRRSHYYALELSYYGLSVMHSLALRNSQDE